MPLEHRPTARSGCRGGEPEECLRHWRDEVNLRLSVRHVNPLQRLRQLGDHRITANRAARRRRQCAWPGHRPGRREAESIDDGEHGASIIDAMVDRRDVVPSRDATARQQLGLTVGTQAAPFACTIRTHLKRRGTPAPDGVNDPLPRPMGSAAGHSGGVVHAIVSVATTAAAGIHEAADSAASPRHPCQLSRHQAFAWVSRSWSTEGETWFGDGSETGGPT